MAGSDPQRGEPAAAAAPRGVGPRGAVRLGGTRGCAPVDEGRRGLAFETVFPPHCGETGHGVGVAPGIAQPERNGEKYHIPVVRDGRERRRCGAAAGRGVRRARACLVSRPGRMRDRVLAAKGRVGLRRTLWWRADKTKMPTKIMKSRG